MRQKNGLVKFTCAVSLFFAMSGCTAIGDWFDSVGEHMPVIGERCEHWQCFTASGQTASDAKKKQIQQQTQQQKIQPPTSPAISDYSNTSSETSVIRH